MSIAYQVENALPLVDFVAVLEASGLGERRPMAEPQTLQKMLDGADLMVTARDAGRIVGVARCITDGVYCLYCSDLAVDRSHQGQGIGKALLAEIVRQVPGLRVYLLISAPKAVSFYDAAGYARVPDAFLFDRIAS